MGKSDLDPLTNSATGNEEPHQLTLIIEDKEGRMTAPDSMERDQTHHAIKIATIGEM